MRVDEVRYVAVEGGGAGGVLIHPGVLAALEKLDVVRQEDYRPAGVAAWSGSSSGSIIATLASSGYSSTEIASLACQEAVDMVFRLENVRQNEYAGIRGTCKGTATGGYTTNPTLEAAVKGAIARKDPAGLVADLLHMSRLVIALYLEKSGAMHESFSTDQTDRINTIVGDSRKKAPAWFGILAKEALAEYRARMARWPNSSVKAFSLLEAEYPQLVPRLVKLIADHAAGRVRGPSVFQILKHDFGLIGGCVWRDYFDHLLAFARFRLRFASLLPSLTLPRVEDMPVVSELADLFVNAVERAVVADFGGNNGPALEHYTTEYTKLRGCTFMQHAGEFHQWLMDSPPPLIISGANISTGESHLFSAWETPDFQVADAVRIATGLPPLFKPVVVDAGDIPTGWPIRTDRFGAGHYLEGLWVDGGLYYNAPFEVFKDAYSSFTGEKNVLGIGAGIGQRAPMATLTNFATSFLNLGYESNVSASRMSLDNVLEINTFDVGFAKPTLTPKALEYYRLDAYWRTFEFFGIDAGL